MPTTTDPKHPAAHAHEHPHHDHNDHDHDHDDHDHSHDAGKAEYIRLGLMALVVLASLTGW